MSQWFAHHGTVTQSSCSERKMLVYPIMFTVSYCFCFHIKVISLKFEFFQICHDFITWNFFSALADCRIKLFISEVYQDTH